MTRLRGNCMSVVTRLPASYLHRLPAFRLLSVILPLALACGNDGAGSTDAADAASLAPDSGSSGSDASTRPDADVLAGCEPPLYCASDGSTGQQFGYSVAIDGDVFVVGAPGEYQNMGVAYVFERQSDDSWMEMQTLSASDFGLATRFGHAVDVRLNVIVVGSPQQGQQGPSAGAAYVFERNDGGIWVETERLLAGDGAEGDRFGHSVATDGARVLIGAPEDDDGGDGSGAAYVFERQEGGTWLQEAKLAASDGAADDGFGRAVDISEDTIGVGAPYDDDLGSGAGSAYIFEYEADSWQQADKLLASDGIAIDRFGMSVSVDSGYAVVGAEDDIVSLAGTNQAYVFARSSEGGWTEAAILEGEGGGEFGRSVSIRGSTVAVGAWKAEASETGAAYLFQHGGGDDWSAAGKVLAPGAEGGDRSGWSVAVSSTELIVGAYRDDNPRGGDAGSVLVVPLDQ